MNNHKDLQLKKNWWIVIFTKHDSQCYLRASDNVLHDNTQIELCWGVVLKFKFKFQC